MKQSIKNLIEAKSKNLTYEELANKLDISKTQMKTIVNGSFGRLSVKNAIKIAKYFNLEVEDIDWRPKITNSKTSKGKKTDKKSDKKLEKSGKI